MHKYIISFFILISLISSCSSGVGMSFDKPVYFLKLNMKSCVRILAVNGVEIESDFDGSASEAEIPINQWIRNGSNYIELMALGQEQMDDWVVGAKCECEVRVREFGEKGDGLLVTNLIFTGDFSRQESLFAGSIASGSYRFESGKLVLSDSIIDVSTGPVERGPNYGELGTTLRRTFTASVPFDEWLFFSGEPVYPQPISAGDYELLRKEFEPIVEDIWNLFESRELSKILPIFERRSKEYDQAFYRKSGETQEMLERSLRIVFNEGYPLNRKDWEYMSALVSYDGRLVKVANAATGNGTVMFYDKESDSNTSYNVYWMKKDGKWIIVR